MSSFCNLFDASFLWRRNYRRFCFCSIFYVFRGMKVYFLIFKRSGMCYRKILSVQFSFDLRILFIAYRRYFSTKCKVLQRGNFGSLNREVYLFLRIIFDFREICTCFLYLVYVLDFCGKERFFSMVYLNRLFLRSLLDWLIVLIWSYRK